MGESGSARRLKSQETVQADDSSEIQNRGRYMGRILPPGKQIDLTRHFVAIGTWYIRCWTDPRPLLSSYDC